MEPSSFTLRRKGMSRTLALALALALGLTACGNGDRGAEPVDPSGGWQLVSGSFQNTPINPISTHPATLEFEDGMLGGTSACNSYGGDYTLDGAQLSVGEIAMTEMACFPQEVMDLESIFLSAITAVDTMSLDGENLVLSGEEANLTFEPVAPPDTAEILGTVWVLDGVIDGDVVSSVSGERATLEMFSDGSLIGSTGCRFLTGNYVSTSIGIQTPSLTANGECPEDLVAQDSAVVSILEGEFRVTIDGRILTLTNGTESLVYRADS
jgi:heat shock protein HslJ